MRQAMTLKDQYDVLKNTSLGKLLSRLAILIVLFLLFGVTTDNFLRSENLITIALQVAIYAVMACGMAFVLIAGAIDLSAGSIVGLSGIVCAIMLRDYGVSIPLAILCSMLVGLLCGLVNGLLVTYVRLLPFIATLGTSWIYRGLTQVMADGQPVTIRNADKPEIAEIVRFIGSGRVLDTIPVAVIIMLVCAVILSVVLNKTVLGRNIFATGSNPNAARLSGINTNVSVLSAYCIEGLMCGLAGVLITARLTSGQVNSGQGYELEAIAACVIGRVSLMGGEGSVSGALIGAFVMGILRNGLNLNRVNSFWQQIIIGIVLIVAVTIDLHYQRNSSKTK